MSNDSGFIFSRTREHDKDFVSPVFSGWKDAANAADKHPDRPGFVLEFEVEYDRWTPFAYRETDIYGNNMGWLTFPVPD